jgi:hypothetical protein
MRTLKWLLCSMVMAIGACAAQPDAATASTQQDATDQQQAQTIQVIGRSQALPVPADETCTETATACRAGRCELINDTFVLLTEVCCSGGTCTTERYKLCGC